MTETSSDSTLNRVTTFLFIILLNINEKRMNSRIITHYKNCK